MDLTIIAGIVGGVIAAIAGVVQVIDYLEKKRKGKLEIEAAKTKSTLNQSENRLVTENGRFIPYYLPPPLTIYGRELDLKLLKQTLQTSIPLILVEGLPGVGKTALARNLANELYRTNQYDHVIWISAKGRNLDLATFLDEIAIAIDQPYINQLALARKTLEVAKFLRRLPCLIVLDNFETVNEEYKEELIAFLLALPQPSKGVITSRPPLPGEVLIPTGAFIYQLQGIDQASSLDLMVEEAQRLGLTSIDAKNSVYLSDLYEITGGNPLAIILSIAQIRHSPRALETIIHDLCEAKGDVFQYIFGGAWAQLDAASRSLLKASSLFATSFSRDALLATQELSEIEFNTAFARVLQFSLIQSNNALAEADLRFEIHPLTKAFADSKFDETDDDRTRACLRLADYFLQLAQKYEVRFWEGREVYGPLEKERLNILSIMDWCYEASQLRLFAELAKAVADFLIVRGYWQLCLTYGERATKAAEDIRDMNLQAWLLVHMQGYLYANRHEYGEAEKVLLKSLDLYTRTKNNYGICEALRNLARVYRKKNELDLAKDQYDKCFIVAQTTHDKKLIALVLNELGKLERDKGNLMKAMELFDDAKKEVEAVDNSIYAGIMCNMAGVAVDLGDLQKAREYSVESLTFFSKVDNKEGIATAKWRLAEVDLPSDPFRSRATAKEAFEIFYSLGMKRECNELQKLILQKDTTSTSANSTLKQDK